MQLASDRKSESNAGGPRESEEVRRGDACERPQEEKNEIEKGVIAKLFFSNKSSNLPKNFFILSG